MNFRRLFTALTLLALCVGLASAQVITGGNTGLPAGSLQCSANVTVPPALRSEGMTDLIGDIVISCTGGVSQAVASTIATVNVTVSLGVNVTSRLIGSGATIATNTSEALLLVDEPNTDLTGGHGAGPAAGFNVCSNTIVGAGPGGCVQTVAANGQATPAINVYQGVVNTNQVTFNGVAANPPVTGGFSRVFRITNVRANTSGLGGGGLAGTTQLLASISVTPGSAGSSGPISLPVTNPVQIAGFIQSGLSTAARNTNNTGGLSITPLTQCAGGGLTGATVLTYNENFGTAFKTRVVPTAAYNGQSSSPVQNVPGTIYTSESGLVLAVNGATAGLADYGTRLKAVFNNIPAGVNIFVNTTSVTNTSSATPAAPAGNSSTAFAQLVLSETAIDANGFPPLSAGTTTTNTATTNLAQLSVVNGSATAVWEVINANPAQTETGLFNFGVWTSYTPNPGANSPPAGTATVNMSYAPTPTAAFSASSGQSASGSLTVPRFADTSSAVNIFSIAVCQTVILYPFVTNQGGFDTGLAIANTSSDPFGTRTQNGSCVMNFYGASAPPPVNSGNIPTGTVYATLASTAASGFQGYMIAVCNFSLAHGFAFISDIGARNLAMGYLGEIIPTGTGTRNIAGPEQLVH